MTNEKLSPLEALEKIIDMALEPNGYLNFTNGCDSPYVEIIETALKQQEQDQKKLKALEIIKKYFRIENLIAFLPEKTQNRFKEEFDLLKEVLL